MSRGVAGLAAFVAAALAIVAVPLPAAAAPICADPGKLSQPIPWAQRMLGPERAWPFSTGGGVTVAVVDSGVDANHPQLRGHVLAGLDVAAGTGPANNDCVGTGTQVAGAIAAQPSGETGLTGVAPGVRILPIRVVTELVEGLAVVEPPVLARGIQAAVDGGAQVIAVSAFAYKDDQLLRNAVANAFAKGATVVAAVGDLGGPDQPNPTPYPAQYAGVLGVGAIGPTGERWPNSQRGRYVDLVAPGADVVALQRGTGMTLAKGTGVACGFVAGAAALVRAKPGGATTPARIAEILQATTTPTAGGPGFGHGLVNPYAAVNDPAVQVTPEPLPHLVQPAEDGASVWARSRTVAIVGTSVALVAVVLVVLAAVTMPRGRRKFWRSALARKPVTPVVPDEPGPPLPLFEEETVR